MRVLWILCLTIGLYAGEVRIALAANMSYAITPIIEAFTQVHKGVSVHYTVGGSGKLATQVLHGAPFDLFLSANTAYPETIFKKGKAVEPPRIYARGALALLSRKPRNLWGGVEVLTQKDIAKIAIANPRTAPYGKAAVEVLDHAGLYEKVRHKFVYGESIAQTVAYATNAADIGIVALSALYAPQMTKWRTAEHYKEVDSSLYTPIDQGMVLLKNVQDNSDAKAFYDFLGSKRVKAILKRYGYRL